jgi:hypothetical protein
MHSSEQCVAAHQFEVSTQLFNTSCSQSTLTTTTNTYVYIPRHWHAPVQSSCQPQPSDLRLAKKTQPAAFETATGVVFTQGITRKRLPASWCVLPYMPYLPPTKGSGPLTPEELRRSSRQAPQPAHTGPDADRNIAVSVPQVLSVDATPLLGGGCHGSCVDVCRGCAVSGID